jgi:hypothetical protein
MTTAVKAVYEDGVFGEDDCTLTFPVSCDFPPGFSTPWYVDPSRIRDFVPDLFCGSCT